MVDRRENARAQHGRERQRHEARNQNGDRNGHREFAEDAPDHPAHEQHGNEDGDERQGDRDDREADLARALQRRLEGLHAFLDMAHDVLEHDDGVVDDEADRQRDGEQRYVVDRIAEHVHEGESADQRDRQGERGDQRRRQRLQEQKDDEDDEHDRDGERLLHVVHGIADRFGTIVDDRDVDGGGKLRLVARQVGLDLIDHLDRVGVGLAIDGENDRALVAEPGGDLVIVDAVLDVGDLVETHRRAVAPGDDQRAVGVGLLELAGRLDRDVLALAELDADRRVGIGGRDLFRDFVDGDVARGGLFGIDLHAHGEFLLTEDQHLRDAGDLRNLLREILLGVIVRHVKRQLGRAHRDEHDRDVGRIDLAEGGRRRKIRRQLA